METKIRTQIITANGFQYEIANELSSDSIAKTGDYTLSCSGKVFKYDSQPVLWLNGCPKIIASNDPELKDVLPVLPQYGDVSEFGVIENLKIKKPSKNCWHFVEDGYIHTSWLSEVDVDEMVERYTRIYGDKGEYCKVYLEQL